MTKHLLLVTIGPVQDFIAQARRTRDLWHGSHMISELSRAVARTLVEDGARLLIPALDPGDVGLRACWRPIRPETNRPPEAIANKIWAVTASDQDPAQLASHARAAVKGCLRSHADSVWQKFSTLLPPEVKPVWDEQVEDVLEFVAGWVALDGRPFTDVRAELDDGVTARKRLRDFRPWVNMGQSGARKSSLDGARVSVLPFADKGESGAKRKALITKLRLGSGEELDAIGLIKRGGAEPEQFIPLVNVALAPWLAWVARKHADALNECIRACESLEVQRLTSPLLADDFRFEASILLPARWPSLQEEQGYDKAEVKPRWETAKAVVLTLRHVTRAREDELYVACLVADGDRMGDAINRIHDPEQLRDFSRDLSAFANDARAIVGEHSGSLVYAGGDDVLAFVPVSRALDCAEALRRRFTKIVGASCRRLGLVDADHPEPSLSVGIGVGHYMESMGELLELGREAEAMAKGPALAMEHTRNALAIIVDKRSGGRRCWRRRWCETLVADFEADMAFTRRLSIGKIHEIEATLRRLPETAEQRTDELAGLLEREVARSLARNEGDPIALEDARITLGDDQIELAAKGYPACRRAVKDWIDRLLIAREVGRLSLVSPMMEDSK